MDDDLPFYTTTQAAEALGIKRETILKMMYKGNIVAEGKLEKSYIFTREQIEKCRKEFYNPGLTHNDIAKIYGMTRPRVMFYFIDRLKIKPSGQDNNRNAAFTYDAATVAKVARILHWEPVISLDLIDERLHPSRASQQ